MSGFFVNVKPLSVNEALNARVVKKGRRTYATIGKTQTAKNFHTQVIFSLPKKAEVIIYDKITLFCNVYFINDASDLDNSLKYFIDALQQRFDFNDKIIYKIVAKKILVTNKEHEGFKFKIEKFEEEENV